MGNRFDVRPVEVALYFLPVETRVPLKFGAEVVTAVTCARVRMRVMDRQGRSAEGWAETPLAVQWTWPSDLSYEMRNEVLKLFCVRLVEAWAAFELSGHPMEVGHAFQQQVLPKLLAEMNLGHDAPMPWLAALVCCSAFDNALHDAYGKLLDRPIYETYGPPFMNRDLAYFLESARDRVDEAFPPSVPPGEGEGAGGVNFRGKYPEDFLVFPRPECLPAWHLVGGLDLLTPDERTGDEPDDGYPVVLTAWIKRDGLKCLKIKLRGTDADWDYERLVQIGEVAIAGGVDWLTSDFNCTVEDPAYVNAILDRLMAEHPRIYGMILYVEQPFPYDLDQHRIDVHSVSARKPLFMDESAHDWRLVRLGRSLGWTGVALKTCKTQTGALLSLCWAKAHGMTLMVQDLTNPMLAQIPHVLLAAHAGTIMGVETNAMQFYPEASLPEAEVHPGLYQRREGYVDLSTLRGPGFGYRLDEIARTLPNPVLVAEADL